MNQTFTDPASGRQYTVDPATGQSQWVDDPPPSPTQQYPAQPYPAPYQQPGPQPAKQGHGLRNTLIIVGVIIVLGIIGSALGGDKDKTTTAAQSPAPAASASTSSAKESKAPASPEAKSSAKHPGIGTAVRDGKFEFTVIKVKPGVTKIGNQYMGKTAQGQFILVTLKVENIGDQSQLFAGSNQKLYDTQGRKFDADNEAAIYLGDQGKSWLNEINPGNTVTGVVVFDVPKGIALAKIELHDSMFSGGVDVALR